MHLKRLSPSREIKSLPCVTIHSSKHLRFSEGFLKQARNEIGKNNYVLLFYSRLLNVIVFEFTSNHNKKSSALKITDIKKSNARISVQAFFNFYKLNIKKYAGKYLAEKEDISGKGIRWIIYLNKRNKKPKLNDINLNNNKANRWFDLEEVSHSGERGQIPYVSIIKTKLVVFSTGFLKMAKDQISNNDHVLFYYSKLLNAIVFEFINNSIDNAVTAKMTKTKKLNASLTAKSFFNFYSINIDKYIGKYLARKEEIPNKGSRWVIYLNEVNNIAKFNPTNLNTSEADQWKDLEKFSRFKITKDLSSYVSIVSSKYLSFSLGFLEHVKNETTNNNYIIFFYSKLLNAIVFKFTNSKKNGARKFCKNKRLNSATAYIKSFLIFYNIHLIKHTEKYLTVKEIIPDEGISWVIYLGKTNTTTVLNNLDNEANRWKDLERFFPAYISISSSKHMIFNVGFLEQAKNEIGNNDYVLLYYSKSLKAIIFEFTNNKQFDTRKISKHSKKGAMIYTRSFFNFYKINIEKYLGKYLAKKEEIPGKGICWVIYLGKNDIR